MKNITLEDVYNEAVKRGICVSEINFSDVAICHVCGAILFADDEAYEDVADARRRALCDTHSVYDEELGGYRGIDDNGNYSSNYI